MKKLTFEQRKQLQRELLPEINRVVLEAAEEVTENFFVEAELAIQSGEEVLEYKDIQDALFKSLETLFARNTILPATTKISGVAWSKDDTSIYDREFLEE